MPTARSTLALSLLVCLSYSTASGQNAPSFLTMWGSYGSGTGQLNYPYGIASSADGYIYVSDQLNFRIVKYTANGEVVTSWGSQGGGPGQFGGTIGLGTDPSGRVYVADHGYDRVQVFESDGSFVRQWPRAGVRDVAIASDGLVHVVGGSTVSVFTQDGAFVRSWLVRQNASATSIALDAAGNTFVADEHGGLGSGLVTKWSPLGNLLASWGEEGSESGELAGPVGIAVDGLGRLFIAEHHGDRVQVFGAGGGRICRWGTAGVGAGEFLEPVDVAVDESGMIYVVDMHNHRIQKFGELPVSTSRISWGALKSRYR